VIAYEPVWAIGTGRVPTESDIAVVHRVLRAELVKARPDGAAIPILYGGSAKPDNAKAILGVDEVGGLLVGGASLDAKGFAAMARAAS
jgi:triosephosphate isomerase